MIESCSNVLDMLAFDQQKDEANLSAARLFTEEKLRPLVTLELLSPDNAREIFELIAHNEDHLSRYCRETYENNDTYEKVRNNILNPPEPKKRCYAIRNGLGQVVGGINLDPDEDFPKEGEISYYLGAEFLGHGYMTKAVTVLSQQAFTEKGYTKLCGYVREDNLASANVFIRAGYQVTDLVEDDKFMNYLAIEFTMNTVDIT